MKPTSYCCVLLLLLGIVQIDAQTLDYPIQPVPFTKVQITDNFWAPRLETNRTVTIPYNFKKSEETGRISNFAKAGHLEKGEFEGIFFNDSDVFKIIEGASYSLMVKKDPALKAYLDTLIIKIEAAQERDGYLYTNRTINPSKAADGAGKTRWSNLKIYHELYNVGHLYEAAVAHFQATGEKSLLNVALKNAKLIEKTFGPGKKMGVPGHQEIEIGLVKLYRVTGEEKYLNLAKFFVDQRGNADGHKLFGTYAQDHIPLSEQREAVGHAVRAGYFYSGATDIAAITGETAYNEALNSIWEDIVYQKTYLTGGIGAERQHEGFGPAYELPNSTAYTETCAAISMLFWNHRLFLRTGEVKYMDVFERTLYNGFLAGVSFEGNTFFYPNPLETNGVNKFNQGICGRSPWFDCSCCPVNVVRVLPSLPQYIYATKGNTIYVNLYIANKASIDLDKGNLQLSQATEYPFDGAIQFQVHNEQAVKAAFYFRIPGWNRNEVLPGDLYTYIDKHQPRLLVEVNGNAILANYANGYIYLKEQEWKKGDVINIQFEMPIRQVKSHKKVAANRDKIAFEKGPLVYCAEKVDNMEGGVLNSVVDVRNSILISARTTRRWEGIPMITISPGPSTKHYINAVPYYAWAHRKMGEMAVWLNTPEALQKTIGVGAFKPDGAIQLFDGSREMLDEKWTYWKGPRLAESLPIKWEIQSDPVDEGTVVNTNDPAAAGGKYGAADIVTKQKFRDFRLHIEFNVANEGGNSGVYLQNRYEIQVLDGDSTTHGMAAIINETESPYHLYNGVGQWNAYDVLFKAARFQEGKLVEKARATVYFNGVKVHEDQVINKVWGGENSGLDGGNENGEGITDTPGGIKLQAEGHNVLYRNIWIRELDLQEGSTDF